MKPAVIESMPLVETATPRFHRGSRWVRGSHKECHFVILLKPLIPVSSTGQALSLSKDERAQYFREERNFTKPP